VTVNTTQTTAEILLDAASSAGPWIAAALLDHHPARRDNRVGAWLNSYDFIKSAQGFSLA
jgi:hypothetical protein